MTKTNAILNFIFSRHEVTFTQIQEFICTLNGKDWNEKVEYYDGFTTSLRRKHRGYYCDSLLGGVSVGRVGILSRFATKTPRGTYKLNLAGYEHVSRVQSVK